MYQQPIFLVTVVISHINKQIHSMLIQVGHKTTHQVVVKFNRSLLLRLPSVRQLPVGILTLIQHSLY